MSSNNNSIKKRTHNCGELNISHANINIFITGWVHRRRDLGGVIFLEVRDRTGIVQVMFDCDKESELYKRVSTVKSEYVVTIGGEVLRRPKGTENPNLLTGAIEIYGDDLYIINDSLNPPINIFSAATQDEFTRLKYRYLDLRTTRMQTNIQLRARATKIVRDYLAREGFLEIETPMLINSTPEGARDYLVPSRVFPGRFFALPQSPQIFKQLLMTSGFERYYQIARCFRDEDLRADRQPEFTQIDFEMSFVERDDVLEIAEGMMVYLFDKIFRIKLERPFPRITHAEAMSCYGTDKPDLRYGMKIEDLTDIFANSEFRVFRNVIASGGVIKGIKVEKGHEFSKKRLDKLNKKAQELGATGLISIKFEDGKIKSSVEKYVSQDELEKLKAKFSVMEEEVVLIIAGEKKMSERVLGELRMHLAEKLSLIKKEDFKFLWVIDFPLFSFNEKEKRIDSEHHPFTAPLPEDIHYLKTDPLKARAGSYDLVLNGSELASGSIRIHKRDIQEEIFKIIGISQEEAMKKFGFLLEAFEYGTPPHGGMAFGFDRLVMIMAGEKSIREVIAFPKTQTAFCPLTGAPVTVADSQLKDLKLL